MKITFYLFILILFSVDFAWSKSKVNLEDVDIKGQLHKNYQLSIAGQSATSLEAKIFKKQNFKVEILDEIPASPENSKNQ